MYQGESYIYKGGSLREGRVKNRAGLGPWRMTGSALTRWELLCRKKIFIEGGSPREGGHEIDPGNRLADFFLGFK